MLKLPIRRLSIHDEDCKEYFSFKVNSPYLDLKATIRTSFQLIVVIIIIIIINIILVMNSFKIVLRFRLAKIPRIIHRNQLLSTSPYTDVVLFFCL